MITRPELDDPVFCAAVEEDYAKNRFGIKALAKKYGMSTTSIRKILIARKVQMHPIGAPLTQRKKSVARVKKPEQSPPPENQTKAAPVKPQAPPVKSKTVSVTEGAAFPAPMSRLMAGR